MAVNKPIRLVRVFAAAVMLSLAAASVARADKAYWHGVISSNWDQGIKGDDSNWYSQPPIFGEPRRVPLGTAVFADDAQRIEVFVDDKETFIGTLLFTCQRDEYDFEIRAKLIIDGEGVVRERGTALPVFFVTGEMEFRQRSDAGRAAYALKTSGTVDFSKTSGPDGKNRVTAHWIRNAGTLNVELKTLHIQRFFRQTRRGGLKLEITDKNVGQLIVGEDAELGGDLVVEGHRPLSPGRYLLLQAGERIGKFAQVVFSGFGPNLTPKIVYSGEKVFLVLTKR